MTRYKTHKTKTPNDRKYFKEAINQQELYGTLIESETVVENNQPPSFDATDEVTNIENGIKNKKEKRKRKRKHSLWRIKSYFFKNLTLLVTILIPLIGFIFWLATLNINVSSTKEDLEKIECKTDKLLENIHKHDVIIKENSTEIKNIKERLIENNKPNSVKN